MNMQKRHEFLSHSKALLKYLNICVPINEDFLHNYVIAYMDLEEGSPDAYNTIFHSLMTMAKTRLREDLIRVCRCVDGNLTLYQDTFRSLFLLVELMKVPDDQALVLDELCQRTLHCCELTALVEDEVCYTVLDTYLDSVQNFIGEYIHKDLEEHENGNR